MAAFLIVDVTDVSNEPIYAEYREKVAELTWSAAVRLKPLKATGDLSGSSCASTLPMPHATGGAIQSTLI